MRFVLQNCNKVIGPNYDATIGQAMALLDENEIPFELVEQLLGFIDTGHDHGAVLVFLPGWNNIYMLARRLQASPVFSNKDRFRIYALHSQMPRDDQKRIFEQVPPDCRKVWPSRFVSRFRFVYFDGAKVIHFCHR